MQSVGSRADFSEEHEFAAPRGYSRSRDHAPSFDRRRQHLAAAVAINRLKALCGYFAFTVWKEVFDIESLPTWQPIVPRKFRPPDAP
jgi:hypothetical protein